MADNNKKESYTKLFNPILEELCKRDFTASELRIIFFIIRSTYGWQKKSYTLSYGFIAEGTGLSKATTVRTVKNLIDKKVLINYEPAIGRKPQKIGLNKHYSEWLVYSRVTIVKRSNLEYSQMSTELYSSDATTVLTDEYQKRNSKKEILKEEEKRDTPSFFTEEELKEMWAEEDEED